MNMKTFILAASASLLMISCNREELARSNQQKDSLLTVLKEKETDLGQKESSITEFISSFTEVERNLDSIAARQNLITSNTDKSRGEFRATQKDRINANITAINELMMSNRNTIAELKRKLKGSSRMNAKLKETIAMLNDQIMRKDQELAALNEKLSSLNLQFAQLQTSMDSISTQNNARAQTIAENTASMHTAYYLVGKAKDLKELKIINRIGGVLGMGKTSKLNENFDPSKFTKIDYTQTSSIPVNSNNVKIITNHPSDTYKLENEGDNKKVVKNIIITNPEKFWSISKFLVVEGTPVEVDKSVSSKDNKQEKSY